MQVIRHHQQLQLSASACALGMFDGVHVGHRMVLENAIREARILEIPSVVFSFSDHPQRLLSKTPTQLLSSLDERLHQFAALGFDYAVILDFDAWLQQLSPQDFVDQILVQTLGAKHVTIGYDYRFGKDKAGNGDLLKTLGYENGFGVDVIEPVKRADSGQIASSTLIRKLLAYGDVQPANQILGRPYQLSGQVVEGFKRGRQLGFPTANLQTEPYCLVPAVGTYGGFAKIKEEAQYGKLYPAVCNIGYSPSFEGGTPTPRIEVHVLGYQGQEFYGKTLAFQFYERLRDEMHFASVDDLKHQIQMDCNHVLVQAADFLRRYQKPVVPMTPQINQ